MKLTVIVRCAPDSPSCGTAASVIDSWLDAGQNLAMLFLQSDAVELCAGEQMALADVLRRLARDGETPVIACVGSAASRGLCDERGTPTRKWHAGVRPGSLGELAGVMAESDRVVTIG